MTTATFPRAFEPGDHACVVYSSRAQLVRVVSRFVAQGLARAEQCWFIGPPLDGVAIRSALKRRGIDVDRQIRAQALRLLVAGDVYVTDGEFHRERADRVFRDGLAQARIDGFRGLRVAADVSWAVAIHGAVERLIAFEAHARAAFAAAPLTGLCLYHRRRLPWQALNGALLTHPLTTAASGQAIANPFYNWDVTALPLTHDRDVVARLQALTTLSRRSKRRR
jgi:two-component system, chemotaxis family, sensor kinase Cph1